MRLLFLLFTIPVLSMGDQVELYLTLNPAGSFTAKSNKIVVQGEVSATQDEFRAKNIRLPIDSLETGLSLRDSHMKKKYFESDQYPEALLLEAQGKSGKFRGILKVHGVEKNIQGAYRLTGKQLETRFKCRMSDFKIKEANYMGVGVEDEVKVSVKLSVP